MRLKKTEKIYLKTIILKGEKEIRDEGLITAIINSVPEESKSGDFIFKGEDCRQVKNGEASKILHMGYHHNQDSEISHDDCSDYFHFDEFHILGRKKIITVRRINDYS